MERSGVLSVLVYFGPDFSQTAKVMEPEEEEEEEDEGPLSKWARVCPQSAT